MKWFKEEEFKCRCGRCNGGYDDMDIHLIIMLDEIREMCAFPIHLNSAYRCLKHNDNIGGRTNSTHTKGTAVDIKCEDDWHRSKLIQALVKLGVTSFGIYPTFIHFDLRDQNACWLG